MVSMRRPSTMGLSFALEGGKPTLKVSLKAGRYALHGGKEDSTWQRHDIAQTFELPVVEGLEEHEAVKGLRWFVRGLNREGRWQVTLALFNESTPDPGRDANEAATFFQVGFRVEPGPGCKLAPRPTGRAVIDEDSRTHEVIYRDAIEWAVGHTCSARWPEELVDGSVPYVETTWVPAWEVPATSPDGHKVFAEVSREITGEDRGAFDAGALADAPDAAGLARLLQVVPTAWRRWLEDVGKRVNTLEADGRLRPALAAQARKHIEHAGELATRMEAGIALLKSDTRARMAFQLSQEAMLIQRRWGEKKPTARLTWRPFQLAFQLLTLAGIATPRNKDGTLLPDRRTMDLLWFPTGGGKTEAYLALTAFTLFHRRLRHGDKPDLGAGVAVLMRYTLRLLTVQQFERAARLILACEWMRLQGAPADLGEEPFSIGLWVGSGATPNKLVDSRNGEGIRQARQLARCPACLKRRSLQWDVLYEVGKTDKLKTPYIIRCGNEACPVHGTDLPIHTIDEQIYIERPGLVIGTVDKFAQIVRNENTASFFHPTRPELIIQDELHLISGPLGTMAGLYEAAIDQLCTTADGVPPKIVGSTATIRRANEQVRQLFNREVVQFPPPVLDAGDSCFAVLDKKTPGRLYVGVTTAGRSPKFVLQGVCASLMQGAFELDVTDEEKDPYWTLVAYFNSLRELGGAHVMMHDDVNDSINMYATLHGQSRRAIEDEPLELTSRVKSEDIPQYLARLEEPYEGPDTQTIAAVLATNMISVGMDIPRLGLMVVNGQPRGMAEYIQATSRVGRAGRAGLVITIYNAGRPRDRSHFEAFPTWHQTLYREVEATSVTPFAPRARDRALHAAIVALARHRVSGLKTDTELTAKRRAELDPLIDILVARAKDADPGEADGVRADAADFLDKWSDLGKRKYWWNDRRTKQTLLIGAEKAAAMEALYGNRPDAVFPTPNSLREVEPSVQFRLAPGLKADGGDAQ